MRARLHGIYFAEHAFVGDDSKSEVVGSDAVVESAHDFGSWR